MLKYKSIVNSLVLKVIIGSVNFFISCVNFFNFHVYFMCNPCSCRKHLDVSIEVRSVFQCSFYAYLHPFTLWNCVIIKFLNLKFCVQIYVLVALHLNFLNLKFLCSDICMCRFALKFCYLCHNQYVYVFIHC